MIICVLIIGVTKRSALKKTKEYIKGVSVIAILSSFVVGLLEGTWYSHGFDVPWWIFSILSILFMFLLLF